MTTLADGGGAGTLRTALAQANATADADTIVFAPGLEGGTVILTQGQLNLTSDVAIDGDRDNDGREIQISGNLASRVVAVGGSGTDARLVDLTVADGNTYGAAAGQDDGGGIRIAAGQALSLEGVTVTGNSTATYAAGGGVFAGNGARLSVTGSTISGNVANLGGGVFLSPDASATIATSRMTGNVASDVSPSSTLSFGGGIAIRDASLVLTRSTVDNNSADAGAGIQSYRSQLTVHASTIAENSTAASLFGGSGAGLDLFGGYAFLANSTVANNQIGRYGADDVDTSSGIDVGGTRLALANTIVAGNFQGSDPADRTASDINGAVAFSNGHNAFGSNVAGNVAGDIEDFDAVRALSDNGGPTPTAPTATASRVAPGRTGSTSTKSPTAVPGSPT